MTKLIAFSPSNLFDFFEKGVDIQDSNVPSFGKLKCEPYSYCLSKNIVLNSTDSKAMLVPTTDEMPITYKSTKWVYNFAPGSRDSIDFHQALEETESVTVFKSEVIQMILDYKWGLVRKYAYAQFS
jgi:hypothetical protein